MRIKISSMLVNLGIVMNMMIVFFSPAWAIQKNGFNLSTSLVPSQEIFRGGPPK